MIRPSAANRRDAYFGCSSLVLVVRSRMLRLCMQWERGVEPCLPASPAQCCAHLRLLS